MVPRAAQYFRIIQVDTRRSFSGQADFDPALLVVGPKAMPHAGPCHLANAGKSL